MKPEEVAEHLWSAVTNHLAVGENEQAKAGLQRLVKMTLPPARMGEALYLLGEENPRRRRATARPATPTANA